MEQISTTVARPPVPTDNNNRSVFDVEKYRREDREKKAQSQQQPKTNTQVTPQPAKKEEPKKILGVKFPFQLGSDKKKDKKPEKSQ